MSQRCTTVTTRGLEEDYARSVGCHERNGPQTLLQRRKMSQYGSELTIRKRCYLRRVAACWPQVVARVMIGHLPYGLITVEGSMAPYELDKDNYISHIYLTFDTNDTNGK